ncbi:hypothetical protein DFH27DRAFT_654392 [Peziza echinospora]|nr:hypothetical protein DFH27DRAFT_654392 [Peziza echinospora]
MATKKTTEKPAASGSSRLHISPLTADTLKSLLPRSLFPTGTEYPPPASFHTIETFPESPFGYVDVPNDVAEKIKKRLNGSVFRGTKIKVKDAHKRKWDPEAAPVAVEEDVSDKKRKKNKKKEDKVYEGIELPDERWVKRAWTKVPVGTATVSSKDKSSKDKSAGKREKNKKDESKRGDCLFKITLPDNVPGDGDDKKKRKKSPEPIVYDSDEEAAKKKKMEKKHKREKVLKEFQNTTKFPQFLKVSQLDPNGKGKAAEFVEGVGWVDVNGQVVDATVVKSIPKELPVVTESPVKKAEVKSIALAEESESSDDSSDSDSDSDSDEESDEEMADANDAQNAESDSDSDSDSDSEDEVDEKEEKSATIEIKPDELTPADKQAEAATNPDSASSKNASDSDSSDEDEEEDEDAASDAESSESDEEEDEEDKNSDEETTEILKKAVTSEKTTSPSPSKATTLPSTAEIESDSGSAPSKSADAGPDAASSDEDSESEEDSSDSESEDEEEEKEGTPQPKVKAPEIKSPEAKGPEVKKPEAKKPEIKATPTPKTSKDSKKAKQHPTPPALKLSIPSTTTTISAPHPLEALFKPTGAPVASTGGNLFNFTPDDEEDEDEDTEMPDSIPPVTPLKRYRSAAPTPDTAVVGKTIHWPEPSAAFAKPQRGFEPTTPVAPKKLPFSGGEAPLLLQASSDSTYLLNLSIWSPGTLPAAKGITEPPPPEEDEEDPNDPKRKKRKGNANDLAVKKHKERKIGMGVGVVEKGASGKDVWKENFFRYRGEWNREWKNKKREAGKLERRKKGDRAQGISGAPAATDKA